MAVYKTRAGTNKRDKLPGTNVECDWIEASKVKHFKAVFDQIVKIIGKYDDARDYVGFSCSVLDGLEKGKLSARSARLLLSSLEKLKSEKKQHDRKTATSL